MQLQLNNNYALTVLPHLKNSVRLIVFDNGIELVCRKETIKNLAGFLGMDEGTAFKGRLQLYKNHDVISVKVKGNNIGFISAGQLQQLLH